MADRIRDTRGRFTSRAKLEAQSILFFVGEHWGNPQTKTKKSAPDYRGR